MARAVAAVPERDSTWLAKITSRVRIEAPSPAEWIGATITALLLVLSFPDFNFPFLAWIALVPLLIMIARRPRGFSVFVLGWFTGTVFFYASCYWLTYSMIHYGGLSSPLAYLLLLPGAVVVGLFPGLAMLATATALRRWSTPAIFFAPLFWAACEWARLEVTGQLWNALGYSQAEMFNGLAIGLARWGGVYAISFLLVLINCAITFVLVRRTWDALIISATVSSIAVAIALVSSQFGIGLHSDPIAYLYVVAVQPNVPMSPIKSTEESEQLFEQHKQLSLQGLQKLPSDSVPRLVIWPESPMNFTYGTDKNLQERISKFTRDNHTSLLMNSLETAPANGAYNSALLINEDGRLIAQYDKIRLMPFGEYVPLPQWLGGSLISGIVGDFTPGTKYTLMPVAGKRAGTFICIESAYPWIARRLTIEGADVLINISNDGYLGPTAVMRQHLANVIFRAVENGRTLLRVTNSGISAIVRPDGFVTDQTGGFRSDVRTWPVTNELTNDTFYTKYGDVFALTCVISSLALLAVRVYKRRSFD